MVPGLYDDKDTKLIKSWNELLKMGLDIKNASSFFNKNAFLGNLVLPDNIKIIPERGLYDDAKNARDFSHVINWRFLFNYCFFR